MGFSNAKFFKTGFFKDCSASKTLFGFLAIIFQLRKTCQIMFTRKTLGNFGSNYGTANAMTFIYLFF